ncbi:MAG: MBL fold metallo-hydrolase [Chloroflexi bacterium]|nr:MBL fold metallo-hydrolase [Chloroflexota bacterium]
MRGAKQIAANLYQIPAGGACAFLVVEDRITVIDAGRRGSGPRILEYLRSLGRSPEEISYIISTHYHLDHIGGIAHLQAASAGRVAVHQSEAPFVQGGKPLPGPFQNPLLAFLMAPFVRLSRPPRFSVDLCLQDGDMFEPLGGMEVVHTPGHTPGSISLYSSSEGLLIAGDALEFRRGRLQLPSRLFTADMAQAKESVRRLAGLDFEVLCLSHYPPLLKNASQALRRFSESLN